MTKAQIEAFKKITPGPWKMREEDEDDPLQVVNFCGEVIAEFPGDLHRSEEINSIAIAALPDLLAEREKMIETLKEMREACAACFRVIAVTSEEHINMLDGELTAAGVKQGFGQRCQELIAEAEGGE